MDTAEELINGLNEMELEDCKAEIEELRARVRKLEDANMLLGRSYRRLATAMGVMIGLKEVEW